MKYFESARADLKALSVAGVALFTWVISTDDSMWWKCPIHQYLGLLCPGCGIQHAIAELTTGNFSHAWNTNATIFIGPVLVAAGTIAQRRQLKWLSIFAIVVSVLFVISYTIWRNS